MPPRRQAMARDVRAAGDVRESLAG